VEDKFFRLHKLFFCGRSEYFKALLTGNFLEGSLRGGGQQQEATQEEGQLPVVALSQISADAFAVVVDFIYSDSIVTALELHYQQREGGMEKEEEREQEKEKRKEREEEQEKEVESEPFDREKNDKRRRLLKSSIQKENVDPDLLLEVLNLADMLMLPVLKNICVLLLTQHINTHNIFEMLETSKVFLLSRLEESCLRWMALHLDDVIERDEFAALVKESAESIVDRQATDSVPFVDEIRSYIVQLFYVEEIEKHHNNNNNLVEEAAKRKTRKRKKDKEKVDDTEEVTERQEEGSPEIEDNDGAVLEVEVGETDEFEFEYEAVQQSEYRRRMHLIEYLLEKLSIDA